MSLNTNRPALETQSVSERQVEVYEQASTKY
jgi:hypothetical protein